VFGADLEARGFFLGEPRRLDRFRVARRLELGG
jgi:hypothetical protein